MKNNNLGSGGVGFVVIPEDVDREIYIQDCYRMCRVSMNGGYGHGIYRDVHVPPYVMQEIKFPNDNESWGSAVIWIKIETTSLPVIVGYLPEDDDYFSFGQNKFRLTRQSGENVIDLFMDANKSNLQLNITDDGNNPSEVTIKLSGKNKKSVFKLISDNEINLSAESKLSVTTYKDFHIQIFDKENNKTKGSLSFNIDNGLEIISNTSTKFKVNDSNDEEKASLEINAKDGKIVIKSEKIILGDGSKKMVLGDDLIDLLGKLCDAISTISVPTPVGPSGPPVNAAQFTVIKNQLESTLSTLSTTD